MPCDVRDRQDDGERCGDRDGIKKRAGEGEA
jgi:hypothetical protein